MPKNEDGEFELILGNRQLLSVFFIVVVLLGVFFTMGYIVGRNSGPGQVDVASAHKNDTKPLVVDSTARQDPPAAPPSTASPERAASKGTQPQQPDEPEKTEPAPRREPPKQEVVKREEPAVKREPPKPEKSSPMSGQPASGQTYLQLAATAQAEAEVMVDALRSKHFKALAMEIPEKPGVYRVLVGPISDGALNKTKSDLQAVGMPGDKAIKKVF